MGQITVRVKKNGVPEAGAKVYALYVPVTGAVDKLQVTMDANGQWQTTVGAGFKAFAWVFVEHADGTDGLGGGPYKIVDGTILELGT